ncbi:MAG: branched-chain amino acid ABC transporter permease [Rhodobacteraceae bacterium]|nr:branched-chain amino acid ABC transporter permease [Paracoccaceae bacterium]
MRAAVLFALVGLLFLLEALTGSWNTMLGIFNMALVSAIMALGVNMQWGYAGLFNVGIVGFVALGGLAPVLISIPPNHEALAAGGWRIPVALLVGVLAIIAAILVYGRTRGRLRGIAVTAILIGGFVLYRAIFDPAVEIVETTNPSFAGNIGGLGINRIFGLHVGVLLAWPVGMLLAAGAAWVIGKIALGLRSDYLAIATLGIGEIIIAVLKNEDWLARGVKNMTNIPRPVPYEVDLQQSTYWQGWAAAFGTDPVTFSTIFVKLCWMALFLVILLGIIWLSERAINSPWGRMMRAIRDNETAAEAMGKDVTRRHLQIFVIGSAVCGLAGAMMVTMNGVLVPSEYTPLRYTFLVWVMVIVGGSGNNWGSVLGAFLIYYLYIKVGDWGPSLMHSLTAGMQPGPIKDHLVDSAAHMRMMTLGVILLLVLRFSPRGLLPER